MKYNFRSRLSKFERLKALQMNESESSNKSNIFEVSIKDEKGETHSDLIWSSNATGALETFKEGNPSISSNSIAVSDLNYEQIQKLKARYESESEKTKKNIDRALNDYAELRKELASSLTNTNKLINPDDRLDIEEELKKVDNMFSAVQEKESASEIEEEEEDKSLEDKIKEEEKEQSTSEETVEKESTEEIVEEESIEESINNDYNISFTLIGSEPVKKDSKLLNDILLSFEIIEPEYNLKYKEIVNGTVTLTSHKNTINGIDDSVDYDASQRFIDNFKYNLEDYIINNAYKYLDNIYADNEVSIGSVYEYKNTKVVVESVEDNEFVYFRKTNTNNIADLMVEDITVFKNITCKITENVDDTIIAEISIEKNSDEKTYDVNYFINIDNMGYEIIGKLIPFNTGRITDYNFEPDPFLTKQDEEYYDNNYDKIHDEIFKKFNI